MADADIITAIVERLKADAEVGGLTAGRVFGGELPDDETAAMPRSAVVVRPSGGASFAAGSFIQHDTQRFDTLSYAATPWEANMLARIVRRSLTVIRRRVIGGCLIHWIEVAGGFSAGRDRDAAWPIAFQSFQAFHALQEPQA